MVPGRSMIDWQQLSHAYCTAEPQGQVHFLLQQGWPLRYLTGDGPELATSLPSRCPRHLAADP